MTRSRKIVLLVLLLLGVLLCGLIFFSEGKKPVVEFLGFTHVLNRRVSRFAISNSTERTLQVICRPTDGYLPTQVGPGRIGYVDVPHPLTNRFWSAELSFQVESHPLRFVAWQAVHAEFRAVGEAFRHMVETNEVHYFLPQPGYDLSFPMDDPL